MGDSGKVGRSGAGDILAAARDLFAAHGFGGVSISAIAQQAGSSKANIFHHFGSKEELHFAVMRDACQRSTSMLDLVMQKGEPLAAQIQEFVQHHLDVLNEDPDRSRLVLREILESGPRRGQELAEKVFGEDFRLLTALFKHAQANGEIKPGRDPAFLAFLLLAGNVLLFQSQHVLRHLADVTFVDDPDIYSQRLSEILLAGC